MGQNDPRRPRKGKAARPDQIDSRQSSDETISFLLSRNPTTPSGRNTKDSKILTGPFQPHKPGRQSIATIRGSGSWLDFHKTFTIFHANPPKTRNPPNKQPNAEGHRKTKTGTTDRPSGTNHSLRTGPKPLRIQAHIATGLRGHPWRHASVRKQRRLPRQRGLLLWNSVFLSPSLASHFFWRSFNSL